jgi:predicted GNAT superfamily acetyltransferase
LSPTRQLTALLGQAFHAALGFAEVGEAVIHGGCKTVRYLMRPLAPEPT